MLKVLGLFGLPATGKSTLMKAFMKSVGSWPISKDGLLVYHTHPEKRLYVLGDYSKEGTFGGTDRLSMSVQPTAVEILTRWTKGKNRIVLFEGDRLCNLSFIQNVKGMENCKSKWILLTAPESVLNFRHKQRGDTQTEKWLKGRVTKIQNIKNAIHPIEWEHSDAVDTISLVNKLRKLCGMEVSRK